MKSYDTEIVRTNTEGILHDKDQRFINEFSITKHDIKTARQSCYNNIKTAKQSCYNITLETNKYKASNVQSKLSQVCFIVYY